MMRISRTDLRYFASMIVLANTPASLLQGLRSSEAIQALSKFPRAELPRYYDRITARAKRTEIELGLSYAILVAALLNQEPLQLDTGRLAWGREIAEILQKSGSTTQRVLLTASGRPQAVNLQNSAADVPIIVIPGGSGWGHQ